jgi:hypothetical protein
MITSCSYSDQRVDRALAAKDLAAGLGGVIALPGQEAAADLTADLGTEMLPVDDLTDLFLAAVGHDAEATGGLLSQALAAAAEPGRTMLDPAADARANELATKARLILGITGR